MPKIYCDKEYGIVTNKAGKYACLYRPYHMIGLELNLSVASVSVRKEPTGCSKAFNADVVAVAKFDIPAGTILDGEGGFYVYGKTMLAKTSVANKCLPLGFSGDKKVLRHIKAGEVLTYDAIEFDTNCLTMQIRKELEAMVK